MATKNPQGNPNLSEQPPAVQSQAQSTSAEPEHKRENAPENNQDETQFFDTTIAKVKKVHNEETDKDEYVTVMSDHLDPGEELKTSRDERLAKEKNAKRGEDKSTDEQAKDNK